MHRKRHPGGIVRVDGKLDPGEAEPVVREVQRRPEERRADAPALPVVAHGHPDGAGVPDARAFGEGLEAEVPDHLSLDTGHQQEQPFWRLREPPAPRLRRLQW